MVVEVEEESDLILDDDDNGDAAEPDVASGQNEVLVTVTIVVDGATGVIVIGSTPWATCPKKLHAQLVNKSRSGVAVHSVVHALPPDQESDLTKSEAQKHSSNMSCVVASG